MRLYMFEHCSLCFRVRMTAALKGLHVQETVVLDDDSATMIGLVGKRVIPILVKDDGKPMLESLDMVRYVDGHGEPMLTGRERGEVAAWADKVVAKTGPLTMPRYPLLGLPEFATIAALDHYTLRKRKAYGDFVELRAKHTRADRRLDARPRGARRFDCEPHGGERRIVARRHSRAAAVALGGGRQRLALSAPGPRLF